MPSRSGIEVHMWRPERRFGWSVLVHRRDPLSGRRSILHYDENGIERWDVVEDNVDVGQGPTYYFTDEILDELARAWTEDKPAPVPATHDLLTMGIVDAQAVRDRLLDLVEYTVRMGAPHSVPVQLAEPQIASIRQITSVREAVADHLMVGKLYDNDIIEATARAANPAYDSATNEGTREAWRHEAKKHLRAIGAIE